MRATLEAKTPAGFKIVFETPELGDRHALIKAMSAFEVELLEAGYEPVSSQPEPASAVRPAPEADKFFMASQLVPELLENSDTPYWRVKGQDGKFPKFAVRVWKEVLAEIGINVEEIPVKKMSLEGYRAYFEVNESGNPKKVTRLEKIN